MSANHRTTDNAIAEMLFHAHFAGGSNPATVRASTDAEIQADRSTPHTIRLSASDEGIADIEAQIAQVRITGTQAMLTFIFRWPLHSAKRAIVKNICRRSARTRHRTQPHPCDERPPLRNGRLPDLIAISAKMRAEAPKRSHTSQVIGCY
jgi:hypothetical protein